MVVYYTHLHLDKNTWVWANSPYPLLQKVFFFVMQTNFIRKIFFDEKSRSLLIQALVIGIFAVFIYLLVQQTAANLERRGISSGFDFLSMGAGYDISIRLIPFTSEDTHLRAYFVGLLNTLMIAICGCFLATILGFFVGWFL